MKKLALSVVILAVAGAGASLGAVGCSSSSTGGAAGDSGTEDVSVSDSGASSDTSTTSDSGTPAEDTGTPVVDSGPPGICVTDAGSVPPLPVYSLTDDGGVVPNTACQDFIAANCAATSCACVTDTASDAGGTQCEQFVTCIEEAIAASDAGAMSAAVAAIPTCSAGVGGAGGASATAGIGILECIASVDGGTTACLQ